MFPSLLILSAIQTIPNTTGITAGSDIKIIGKVVPRNYTAIRDNHTLPKLSALNAAKRKAFTGSITTLDFPQKGDIHIMNFRNGNRQVLDDPKQKRSENQVSLAKVLATLPPKIDIRYAVPGYAGFEVRLPGQEKKLASFTGKLISIAIKAGQKGITISVKNGKVVSSEWLKPLDNRR